MNQFFIRSLSFILAVGGIVAPALADLGIWMTDNPDPVRLGQTLTYQITVTNGASGARATNTVVTDVLPTGVAFVSCSVNPGSYNYSEAENTVYCNLGTLAVGATAGVTLVVSPTVTGVYTNEAGVMSDNVDGARTSAATTVNAANRAPELTLPGDLVLPVGSSTNFTVLVTDPDHDAGVFVTNTVRPAGATFVSSNFAWTATTAFLNTTNPIVFVANDNQGMTNSVVTNSLSIVVPWDWNTNGISDGWEWTHFSNLTTSATGDNVGDGMDNYAEYIAGTQPTNARSEFRLTSCATLPATSNHQVTVSTEAGRRYTIYWADGKLTNNIPWQPFANTNAGVWIETGSSSTSHVFTDTEGTNTTGGAPAGGVRFYRVKVSAP